MALDGMSELVRRVRRTSLGVKMAVLAGALMALVVVGTFWALGVEIRSNTRAVLVAALTRQQRTLRQLQERDAGQLLYAASLVAQSPSFQYNIETYRIERNAGGAHRSDLVRTVERQLAELLNGVNTDLILVTDDSGRVFARAARIADVPDRGASLAPLSSVRHALDPSAPADSGELAVLDNGASQFEVAVYPLVSSGFTVGALLLGRRLDSRFVAGVGSTFDGDVVLTSGSRYVSGTARAPIAETMRALASASPVADGASTVSLGGEEYITAAVPLGKTQSGEPVRLWMLQPLTRVVRALTRSLARDFLLYGLLAVLVAGIGAALVTGSVLRPFHAFVAHMRSGAASEQRGRGFDASASAAEVRTLNDSFDQLMDSLGRRRRELEQRTAELAAANVVLTDEIRERTRVEQALRESEAQLRQSQKLEAIGTLAGGIAHDFNNLITVISGYTQLALLRAAKGSASTDDLRQVLDASERAAKLTHQLLAFSRKQVLQPTVLDVSDVVDGVAPMLRRIIGEQVQLRIERDEDLARVRADRGQLEQVIINLAVNARDAMPEGGTLTLRTRNVASAHASADGAGSVALVVTDTGVGMPADVRERIFEPFFTTKEPGKGTGLGLSTVYGIVSQSGGTVDVDSTLGVGTSFTISLPAVEAVAGVESAEEVEGELPRGTETILLVEDADDVRVFTRRTLEEQGYAVLPARNAEEALEIAKAAHADVLLTDIVMPRVSGPQLVQRYVETYGRPPVVIYMSGYADDALAHYELEPATVFLRKPFSPAVLARTVRQALDSARKVVADAAG